MTANSSLPSARLRNIQDDVPADSEIGNDEAVFYWDTTNDALRVRARINGDMKDVRPFDSALTATAAELNSLDDSASFADGLSRVRLATATYDFAEHGGAAGAINLGVTIPDNAIILDGMIDVITTCTTAAADAGTMAIHVNSANDIVTAIAVSDGTNPWDEGLHAIKPLGTAATAVKTTAARAITATIATQNFTAGKFIVFLRYVLSA